MNDQNILFIERTRKKHKSWKYFFTLQVYYSDVNISLKERVYTFLFGLENSGYTTKGEQDWAVRMMSLDMKMWNDIENKFKGDYKEYLLSI